jgi:mannan polymerase II complex MNN11 subunit
MQFALPPRRSPLSLPGAHSSRLPLYRRKQLKTIAIFAFAILALLYLLSQFFNSPSTLITAPAGTAGVVIVTLLDRQSLSEGYINKIVSNREDYAKRHGKIQLYRRHLRLPLTYSSDQATQTSSQAPPTTKKL